MLIAKDDLLRTERYIYYWRSLLLLRCNVIWSNRCWLWCTIINFIRLKIFRIFEGISAEKSNANPLFLQLMILNNKLLMILMPPLYLPPSIYEMPHFSMLFLDPLTTPFSAPLYVQHFGVKKEGFAPLWTHFWTISHSKRFLGQFRDILAIADNIWCISLMLRNFLVHRKHPCKYLCLICTIHHFRMHHLIS